MLKMSHKTPDCVMITMGVCALLGGAISSAKWLWELLRDYGGTVAVVLLVLGSLLTLIGFFAPIHRAGMKWWHYGLIVIGLTIAVLDWYFWEKAAKIVKPLVKATTLPATYLLWAIFAIGLAFAVITLIIGIRRARA